MKSAIIFLAVIGVALCEYCSQTNVTAGCGHVACFGADLVPLCEASMCTCGPKPVATCSTISDCDKSNYWAQHSCHDSSRHCVDTKCTCYNDHHWSHGHHGDGDKKYGGIN